MSTMTDEIEELINEAAGDIACEWHDTTNDAEHCTETATWVVHVTCPPCGEPAFGFMCAVHASWTLQGKAQILCQEVRKIAYVTEAKAEPLR